jgi:prolyl-tRNA synthetase
MWKWIKRGVPLRVEIGANELADGTATITRRDIGRESKRTISADELVKTAPEILTTMQSEMLSANAARNKTMIHNVSDLAELDSALAAGTIGFFRLPYAKTLTPEFDTLMDTYKISRRCLDESDPTMVFVAKSY